MNSMGLLPGLAVLSLVLPAPTLLAQTAPRPVLPLYSGTIPDSRPSSVQETSVRIPAGVRIAGVVQPALTVFLPPRERATGTAVIICPGGGYARLSIDHEGYDVAQRLTEMGVAAFVLKYRLPNDESQPDKSIAPLLDAQQALRLVREQAPRYGLNPERIGLMGFSAGGHLAATAGTQFARPVGANPDPASVRPAFLILLSFSSAANNSATCARFVRTLATDQYATIAIRTKSGKFADVSAYRSGAQKLSLKFLSPGPGTRVLMVMQDFAKVAYPAGNYAGDFFATTTAAANIWETLTFEFEAGVSGTTFDPTVTATSVDQIALIIAPGTNSGATYYFDDLTGPALASTTTATRTTQNVTAGFDALYPNPTSGRTQLPYRLQKAAVVSLAVFDNLGRRVVQVLAQQRQPAGEFKAELNAARLAPGLYTCRLTVDGAALTRQLSVQ